MRYHPTIKRIIDFTLATAAFLVFSPFFFLIIVLIKLDSPGPPFFIQERVGKGMKLFRLIKFRSMTCRFKSEDRQFDAGDSCRITRIGTLLRKTKLDELPELVNIIRGDMSIIGPRPEVPKYVGAYSDGFKKILQIRPGLSDFASIKYRNEEEILTCHCDPDKCYREIILPDKLELAKRYCEDVSFKTDFGIVLDTIKCILRKDPQISQISADSKNLMIDFAE